MFKKGHTPHNRGDSYVHSNYRNKPRNDDYEMMERMRNERINPFKLHIEIRDLAYSKNSVKSNRIEL